MFGSIIKGITRELGEFVDDPVGKTIETATQPIRDGIEVVHGLTEGELRIRAAARLGADVAAGMAVGELIEWWENV